MTLPLSLTILHLLKKLWLFGTCLEKIPICGFCNKRYCNEYALQYHLAFRCTFLSSTIRLTYEKTYKLKRKRSHSVNRASNSITTPQAMSDKCPHNVNSPLFTIPSRPVLPSIKSNQSRVSIIQESSKLLNSCDTSHRCATFSCGTYSCSSDKTCCGISDQDQCNEPNAYSHTGSWIHVSKQKMFILSAYLLYTQ